MIILLSPEEAVAHEIAAVNTFFERGLSLFHIRKRGLTDSEMMLYVEAIHRCYRKQLVLHSHFHLANELGIERLHIKEEDRKQHKHRAFTNGFKLSTSVHAITTFNTLLPTWDYAFLSPVFPSISKKGYGTTSTVLKQLPMRRNPHVQLVGLGGIDDQNYDQVFKAGADRIALLGAIWTNPKPIQVFDTIQKN